MTDTSPNSRYQGKPLLWVLERYVLWAINHLQNAQSEALVNMTPKLQDTFKITGTWQEVVEQIMELPPSMPEVIRELWTKNTAIATANNMELSAEQFAEMFVDQNWT